MLSASIAVSSQDETVVKSARSALPYRRRTVRSDRAGRRSEMPDLSRMARDCAPILHSQTSSGFDKLSLSRVTRHLLDALTRRKLKLELLSTKQRRVGSIRGAPASLAPQIMAGSKCLFPINRHLGVSLMRRTTLPPEHRASKKTRSCTIISVHAGGGGATVVAGRA